MVGLGLEDEDDVDSDDDDDDDDNDDWDWDWDWERKTKRICHCIIKIAISNILSLLPLRLDFSLHSRAKQMYVIPVASLIIIKMLVQRNLFRILQLLTVICSIAPDERVR